MCSRRGHGRFLEVEADALRHGNQPGPAHSGLLCELTDDAIGTAHSTLMNGGESIIRIDLKATFVRLAWQPRSCNQAWVTHRGRTSSHYRCDIQRNDDMDDMVVASIASAVMTLTGDHAPGEVGARCRI